MTTISTLLKVVIALALLWWQANYLLGQELWQVLLAVFLCALPLIVFWMQQVTVQKILRRLQFKPSGYLFRFFSGRFLSLLLVVSSALIAALFLLVHLYTFNRPQWFVLFLSAPIFILMYRYLLKVLAKEYKTYLLQGISLRLATLLAPIILAVLMLLMALLINDDLVPVQSTLSLTEFISVERQSVEGLKESAALYELALLQQTWEGIKNFALFGRGNTPLWLIVVASLLEYWLVGYLVCSVLGAFLLPRTEIRRSLGPLSDEESVPALTSLRIMLLSAVVSFFTLFVFVPLSAYVELWARSQQPEIRSIEQKLVLELEQIGDGWYKPGTWGDLQSLRTELLSEMELSTSELTQEIDLAYGQMENNVDYFLDWYYSLGGEYSRIAKLLSGDLEMFLASKLTENLLRGDVFANFENNFSATLESHERLQARYLQAAETLLTANQVQPGEVSVRPLRQLSLTDVFTPPVHDEFIQLQSRLVLSTSGGTTAGLMTSLVAAKLSSRLLAKGSFKIAAKALGKLIASKAGGATAGAGAGAAAGAAAGSFIPVLGTAVGAVLGGIVGGVATGLAIDKALIEFEETLSRDAFKTELLLALEDSRKEFMQGIQE